MPSASYIAASCPLILHQLAVKKFNNNNVSGSAKEVGTAATMVALCKEAKCDTAKNRSFWPVGCRITGDRGSHF